MEQGRDRGEPCLIDAERPTIASFLKKAGYHTLVQFSWMVVMKYLSKILIKKFFNEKNDIEVPV